MGTRIHPTAMVEQGAELGEDVVVGPYSLIGANVRVGDGTEIGPYAVLEGNTVLGRDNRLFAGAVIGTRSQSLKDSGKISYVRIGDGNTFREYVTVNCGCEDETQRTTTIGDHNLFMALVHVAHDCVVGNNITMANLASLSGHVVVEDKAVLGGMAGIHQYVVIGTMAMVAGCSKVVKDVLPYTIVDGNPARCSGLNTVALQRNGVSERSRRALKNAYRVLCRSALNTSQAIQRILSEVESCSEITHLIEFVSTSDRGISK